MAANEPTPIVVCDAGPLIHLDELRCLDVLLEFSLILVPEAVWQEVQRHRPTALRRRRIALTRVSDLPRAEPHLKRLVEDFSLDLGEEQALRLMRRYPGAILLSDDDAARNVARGLRYAVHGTLGLLLLAVERGRRSRRQVFNLLRTIRSKSTLHVSTKVLTAVIAQLQEGLL